MPKQKAQKPVREVVRETFTPSRVGLLSWAFAAVVMGTVGLASYQFGNSHRGFTPSGPGGVLLPPPGGIETTASINPASGHGLPVEVMRLPAADGRDPDGDLSQSQIDVLQKEIVGLRRRLIALSEQNIAYSRRIAALEQEVSLTRPSSGQSSGQSSARQPENEAGATVEPIPGVVISEGLPGKSGPETAASAAPITAKTPAAKPDPKNQSSVFAPPQRNAVSETTPELQHSPPRLISLQGDTLVSPVADESDQNEPVRIVSVQPAVLPEVALPEVVLPDPGPAPQATGSIPATAAETLPGNFDPTQTSPRPDVITPSSPAGRLHGGGDSQLKRSDFGAVIGHYETTAAAAKAWADFKNQNVERMRDLRPLLLQRTGTERGIALMVGPFANAADAATACLHLLDVTELCRPAIYAGDPLVTASEFRDSAF